MRYIITAQIYKVYISSEKPEEKIDTSIFLKK